ncbi:TetR/AcrR family transcriptional regulator [Microbacterium oleivorans]|uniref:TetR family transcriptional regulator C-terminal domain-containing protein n=1 Tax=Microbacterium oleivorans TaxID=273677 RepID=A0A7D5F565_9MICO|nr:TetR family transcriptional regulator C-terminal domain-containing protein [Microbacterium oleivorans]QLD11887.1 TetR family transcriptional regulator C-terminal domain-containing protein [Microbacterium oleivorans]
MPRLIDHDDRNDEIAAAAFRVLARDGLAALSVRRVADEAGIATASLRRAFATQDALRRFCFARLQTAVAARIRAVTGEGRERAMQWMRELLPLDATRRTELTVQLQLSRLALTDSGLSESARELHEGVRRVCAAVLDGLSEARVLADGLDLPLETVRLHALLDGLALHLLWTPSDDPARDADRVLARHLDTLAR